MTETLDWQVGWREVAPALSLREPVEADHYPQIQRSAREISRGTVRERWLAALSLGRTRDERAVSPLLRGTSDSEDKVRLAAAQGLASFRVLPDWAAEPLSRILRDSEPGVRLAAVQALPAVQTRSASTGLVAALGDTCSAVRAAAAEALACLGRESMLDEDAILPLIGLLGDGDEHVAYQAYWALAAQGGSALEGVRAAWRWSDRGQAVWRTVARV